MKTAEQVLKILIHDCENGIHSCSDSVSDLANEIIDAMKIYANEAISEQLLIAAKEAKTRTYQDYNYDVMGSPPLQDFTEVDIKSIINCTRVVLK